MKRFFAWPICRRSHQRGWGNWHCYVRLPAVWLLFVLVPMLSAEEISQWKDARRSALDKLELPPAVQSGLRQRRLDNNGQNLLIPPGTVYQQSYRNHKRWGKSVCRWQTGRMARRYVYRTENLVSRSDSSELYDRRDWILDCFEQEEVGLKVERFRVYKAKGQEIVFPEGEEWLSTALGVTERNRLQSQLAWNGSVFGQYGLSALDARVDCPLASYLALSAGLALFGQAPYDSLPNYRYRRIKWEPWDLSRDLKVGAKLATRSFTLYGYYGWHQFRNQPAGEMWEGELIVPYSLVQLEERGRWFPGRDYLWSRTRFHLFYVATEGYAETMGVGAEYLFEGDDRLGHQSYYYSRTGLFWEYLSQAAPGLGWGVLIGAGYGGYGLTGQLEVKIGIQ